MTKDELTLQANVRLMEKASGVVCSATLSATPFGIERLKGAHIYLYAAMLADFVRDAKRQDFIGPTVGMKDGSAKPTDQFILDHLFDVIFKPLLERGGAEFLEAVRRKTDRIVTVHNRRPAPENGEATSQQTPLDSQDIGAQGGR